MKGVVFVEFLEMVEAEFSPEMADDIIDACDLPSGGAYTSVGTYSHREMVALVGALSERTGTPAPDLIRAFGEFLFERFHVHHAELFDGIGNSLDFLERIEDVIHVQVRKLYPNAELPRFEIDRPDRDHLSMLYRSDRHMGDLAEGLIRQCIAHYGTPVAIARYDLDDKGGHVRFELSRT
ncbi:MULTISPECIES: heme NO-binding domain-containing protein [unclassified Thiocapsa]|uniref:heme NO-binding domain-containing protein n=1 Tax=unclassified Thiocapsa TaxID=2641286 RepID=UPI0035B34FEE